MPLITIKITIRDKSGEVISEHALNEGEHLIGRDKSSDIFIGDEYVSRKHAKLFISNDAIEIEDLESSSGTSLVMDDVTVSDRILVHPSQKIRISDLYLDISKEEIVDKTKSTPSKKSIVTPPERLRQGGMITFFFALLGIILWAFIWPSASHAPRTRDEIFREKTTLPVLYLTEKTGRRLIRPDGKDYFIDKDNGEICWRAIECQNPNCPAKASNGSLHLFISPDPTVILNSDGTLGFNIDRAKNADQLEQGGGCPECLKIRNLDSESTDIRDQYASYVRYHILPKTVKRLEELDEEYEHRVEWEKENK